MKLFRIFSIIFIILYFCADIYFDKYVKVQSGGWLAIKLVGLAVMLSAIIYSLYRNGYNSKPALGFFICIWTLWAGFYGYREIAKYKSDKCYTRFGPEFNQMRRKLGIPEIPADWRTASRNDLWKGKDTIGHISKDIDIDSACAIESEEDRYRFSPIHGIPRDITITTHYAKGKGQDSIFYHWVGGIDTNRMITRHEADSIFAAEKIKKDY